MISSYVPGDVPTSQTLASIVFGGGFQAFVHPRQEPGNETLRLAPLCHVNNLTTLLTMKNLSLSFVPHFVAAVQSDRDVANLTLQSEYNHPRCGGTYIV